MVTEATFPADELWSRDDQAEETEATGETTPSKKNLVQWEVVAFASGRAEAAIIQGRLESEGIPARVQQEPAGLAIGLTTGLLGQVKVLVPEPLVEKAVAVLDQPGEFLAKDEDA
jgi:hypothetical protein